MAAKKLFTQIFIYFSKPFRLLYSLIIYEIVNFSFFALYSLLLLSFFLYLKSVPGSYIRDCSCTCIVFVFETHSILFHLTLTELCLRITPAFSDVSGTLYRDIE